MLNYFRLILLTFLLCCSASGVSAQEKIDATHDSLHALGNLIQTRDEKNRDLEKLKDTLKTADDEIEQEELKTAAEQLQNSIANIEQQISALASGFSEKEFNLDTSQQLDLQAEIQQLLQPFIIMLRSATEDARQIESLRHVLLVSEHHQEVADNAIKQIGILNDKTDDKKIRRELKNLLLIWNERLEAANDLYTTAQRQLETKILESQNPSKSVGKLITTFFAARGKNFSLGLLAFLSVFFTLRFLGRNVISIGQRRGLKKSFATRLSSLIYSSSVFIFATTATLITFNLLNDWLLLGLSILFLVAIIWLGIKMLPNFFEQISLYLNLGAVQEGERVIFNGIPWRVKKLDFYTDLENPALEGGNFTLPIRELTGLHSRPANHHEDWFPTKILDWVKIDDEIGQVVFQSPELVQIIMLGGARNTIPAATFFAQAPINLSYGSRVEIIFGISYKHQTIAHQEIITKLTDFIQLGLLEILDKNELLKVGVELLAAGSSSIDYEIEADISGNAAMKYETVERTLAKLCVEACNQYNWEIPFPQLVVHQN